MIDARGAWGRRRGRWLIVLLCGMVALAVPAGSLGDSGAEQVQADQARSFLALQDDLVQEITPLSNGETIEDFYDLTRGTSGHSQTGLEVLDTSLAFLWDGPHGTSLVVIHDAPGANGDGSARVVFDGLPVDEGAWVVQDSVKEFDGPQDTDVSWAWGEPLNDGGAWRGGLDADVHVTLNATFSGIDAWQVLGGQVDAPERTELGLDENLTLCRPCPTNLTARPAIAEATVDPVGASLRAPELAARLTLAENGMPVAGQEIAFQAGNETVCTGTTNATGVATCGGPRETATVALNLGYEAVFAGDGLHGASQATAPLLTVDGTAVP